MASSSGSVAKEGAIVTAIGGVPVQSMADLRARYDSVATGDTVAVTFERDETKQTLRLEKTEMNVKVRTQRPGGGGLRRR
jgi:S1-C subfamily serine protease